MHHASSSFLPGLPPSFASRSKSLESELSSRPMAVNPQLFANGMPVPFYDESFVLGRDGVEFHVDRVPRTNGQIKLKKGTIYLSNIRVVFVAKKPVGNFVAFDMPLLYIHGEKFNQPVFHCNNITGIVEPVIPENQSRAVDSSHSFKILFKDGGCGTFVPLFLNLIATARQFNQNSASNTTYVDPLWASQIPVEQLMRQAHHDPKDPSKIFLQQPVPESSDMRTTPDIHSKTCN